MISGLMQTRAGWTPTHTADRDLPLLWGTGYLGGVVNVSVHLFLA